MIESYSLHVRDIVYAMFVNFPLKAIVSTVLVMFEFLFGTENQMIGAALVVLIMMDFLTAFALAKHLGNPVTSRKAVKSAFKVGMYGLLFSAGHMTDLILLNAHIFDRGVAAFLAVTEMISIIENTGRMGYAIPQKLLAKLQQIRDDQ